MIMVIPFIAFIVGLFFGPYINHFFPWMVGPYLAVFTITAIDALIGGIRNAFESQFYSELFFTGIAVNIIVAYMLAWLGDQIGLDLFLAIAIILGGRIFRNIGLLRRVLIQRYMIRFSKN